jgi:S-adenosylmethionine decarboxylase proenzyme
MDDSAAPTLYSVDLADCGELAGLSAEAITAAFGAALRRAGATIVHGHTHAFPGRGLTCVFILSESHAVLHTWPETGTVNLDIFSCSTRLKSLEAIEELSRSFGAQQVTVQEVPRADGHGPRPHGRD